MNQQKDANSFHLSQSVWLKERENGFFPERMYNSMYVALASQRRFHRRLAEKWAKWYAIHAILIGARRSLSLLAPSHRGPDGNLWALNKRCPIAKKWLILYH